MIEIKETKGKIENFFPFDKFRQYQQKILTDIVNDFENGYNVIILEAPVGFGKSPVNIALGLYYKPAFYTTPQVKLVNQLSRDFCPDKLAIDGGYGNIISLLGRRNYICKETKKPSDICPYRKGVPDIDERGFSFERKCSRMNECTYWIQKKAALSADITIITFAMLVINSYLNFFGKREILIVDECHNLENQVANLFAGFKIGPNVLPKSIKTEEKKKYWKDINEILPTSNRFSDYIEFFHKFKNIMRNLRPLCNNEREKDKIDNLRRKVRNMFNEVEEKRTWVIDIPYNDSRSRIFKPIFIDNFLKKHIWNQGEKIILSSATIPFRQNPTRWLERLGLNEKKFKFHSVPMSFPVENRPIFISHMGKKMTYSEEKKNWTYNMNIVKNIIKKHIGENGVIHTQSYERAKRVFFELKKFSCYLHNGNEKNIINEWIQSKKFILISPSIKDGVDLKDDLCRFQILLKIPYPNIKDSRVKYLLNEKHDWAWYNEETRRDIVQMYGRAIRSPTDYAAFYIIDGSFNSLTIANFPKWFLDALK